MTPLDIDRLKDLALQFLTERQELTQALAKLVDETECSCSAYEQCMRTPCAWCQGEFLLKRVNG